MDIIGTSHMPHNTFFDTEMSDETFPSSAVGCNASFTYSSGGKLSNSKTVSVPAGSGLLPANTLLSKITVPSFDVTPTFTMVTSFGVYGYIDFGSTGICGSTSNLVKITQSDTYTIPELVFYTNLTDSSELTITVTIGYVVSSAGSGAKLTFNVAMSIPADYIQIRSFYIKS